MPVVFSQPIDDRKSIHSGNDHPHEILCTNMDKNRSMHKMWSTEIRVEWCYRRNISMLHELFSKILDDTCATLSVEYTVK
jgi:hypothetical protein